MRVRGLRTNFVTLLGVIALAGCSELWPSLEGGDPAGGTAGTPGATTTSTPTGGTIPGQPTGTVVGARVAQLGGELQTLQNRISAHNDRLQQIRAGIVAESESYHGTVAAMNARLQIGTTPGNPVLIEQYNSAERNLDGIARSVSELNQLANAVAADARTADYLSETARATFTMPGAVDEDHRQLAVIQDEIDRSSVLIDRLLTDIAQDVRRQSNYLATERGNLNVLAAGIRTGEIFGGSLANQAPGPGTGAGAAGGGFASDYVGRPPLVVIRFDRENVPYQQAVYNAVNDVLDREPNAMFDLVAVAPDRGDPARLAVDTTRARRHADNVQRSLVEFGLPPSRIRTDSQTSTAASSNEVRLYVR